LLVGGRGRKVLGQGVVASLACNGPAKPFRARVCRSFTASEARRTGLEVAQGVSAKVVIAADLARGGEVGSRFPQPILIVICFASGQDNVGVNHIGVYPRRRALAVLPNDEGIAHEGDLG